MPAVPTNFATEVRVSVQQAAKTATVDVSIFSRIATTAENAAQPVRPSSVVSLEHADSVRQGHPPVDRLAAPVLSSAISNVASTWPTIPSIAAKPTTPASSKRVAARENVSRSNQAQRAAAPAEKPVVKNRPAASAAASTSKPTAKIAANVAMFVAAARSVVMGNV